MYVCVFFAAKPTYTLCTKKKSTVNGKCLNSGHCDMTIGINVNYDSYMVMVIAMDGTLFPYDDILYPKQFGPLATGTLFLCVAILRWCFRCSLSGFKKGQLTENRKKSSTNLVSTKQRKKQKIIKKTTKPKQKGLIFA